MRNKRISERSIAITTATDTIATAATTPYAPFSLGKLLGRLALAFHFGMAMILLFWMVFYTPLPY